MDVPCREDEVCQCDGAVVAREERKEGDGSSVGGVCCLMVEGETWELGVGRDGWWHGMCSWLGGTERWLTARGRCGDDEGGRGDGDG